MKDYRLSEIKEICEKMHNKYGENACIYCENEELGDFCQVEFENYPTDWYANIEPRDIIELPHKEFHEVYAGQGLWFVFYRNGDGGGLMESRYFNEEENADAFLAKLKGGKQ